MLVCKRLGTRQRDAGVYSTYVIFMYLGITDAFAYEDGRDHIRNLRRETLPWGSEEALSLSPDRDSSLSLAAVAQA
jgi:hypothetical protein